MYSNNRVFSSFPFSPSSRLFFLTSPVPVFSTSTSQAPLLDLLLIISYSYLIIQIFPIKIDTIQILALNAEGFLSIFFLKNNTNFCLKIQIYWGFLNTDFVSDPSVRSAHIFLLSCLRSSARNSLYQMCMLPCKSWRKKLMCLRTLILRLSPGCPMFRSTPSPVSWRIFIKSRFLYNMYIFFQFACPESPSWVSSPWQRGNFHFQLFSKVSTVK